MDRLGSGQTEGRNALARARWHAITRHLLRKGHDRRFDHSGGVTSPFPLIILSSYPLTLLPPYPLALFPLGSLADAASANLSVCPPSQGHRDDPIHQMQRAARRLLRSSTPGDGSPGDPAHSPHAAVRSARFSSVRQRVLPPMAPISPRGGGGGAPLSPGACVSPGAISGRILPAPERSRSPGGRVLSPLLALPGPHGDFSGSGRAPPFGRRAGSGGTPLQGSFSKGSNANVKPSSVLEEPAAGLETRSSPRTLGADSCGTHFSRRDEVASLVRLPVST